jgi:hypothetical protein
MYLRYFPTKLLKEDKLKDPINVSFFLEWLNCQWCEWIIHLCSSMFNISAFTILSTEFLCIN